MIIEDDEFIVNRTLDLSNNGMETDWLKRYSLRPAAAELWR